MTRDLHAFLRRVDLLQHVSEETLEAVANVCTVRDLQQGERLFDQGDRAEFMFMVYSGALEAWAHPPDGEEHLLRILGPGEVGGLTSIVLQKQRSAGLRAARTTKLALINSEEMLRLLDSHPDLSRSLIAVLSSKVRRKTQRLAGLLGSEASGRFRVAFFDTKAYDKDAFQPLLGEDIHCTWLSPRLDSHTAALAADHQAVCAFVNDDLSAPTLKRLSELGIRLIALRCAGFNNVDVAAAGDLGIRLVRVPAYSPHAVAEHALALLLTLNRKTHRAHTRVKEGNFSLAGLVGSDLFGSVAGVIGLGNIGRCCARLFRGFGMTVLGVDAYADPAFAAEAGVELTTLDILSERSDVISLHCPLTPDTYHMIDTERIARMKPGVILINTSRGGLIDSRALISGLKTGKIGAAGLDVYEEESEYFFEDRSDRVIADDLLARLMTFNNVLITSHQAFLTRQALHNIAETTLQSIRQYASEGSDATFANGVQIDAQGRKG